MPTAVNFEGKTYESLKDAADALGFAASTIRYHLVRYGDLSRLGAYRTPCVWQGRSYPSMRDVARAAGVSQPTVWKHLERHGHLEKLKDRRKA